MKDSKPPICTLDVKIKPKPSTVAEIQKYLRESTGPALEGATLSDCTLELHLPGRDIKNMTFLNVTALGADFNSAHAEGAKFRDSDLTGANFDSSTLKGATFQGNKADLTKAHFIAADLTGARMIGGVTMKGANLAVLSLQGLRFEPHDLPDPLSLAQTRGLETMIALDDPSGLYQLTKKFSDDGLDARSREVVLALRRSDQINYRAACFAAGTKDNEHPAMGLRLQRTGVRMSSCWRYVSEAIAFDATCEFGRRPWRPLGIIAGLAALWAVILTVWLVMDEKPGVVLVFKTRDDGDLPLALHRLVSRAYPAKKRTLARVRVAIALTFSSVFNLPFKDIDVGRWLRMVSARDYEFRARGALRIFTGCLSLLCFSLLALCVLSALGNPFNY